MSRHPSKLNSYEKKVESGRLTHRLVTKFRRNARQLCLEWFWQTAMSFFECSDCSCVEDTSLCSYWVARLREAPTLCSACDPKIARWHGQFPREPAKHWLKDKRGLLFKKSEVEDWLGQSIEIGRARPPEYTSQN